MDLLKARMQSGERLGNRCLVAAAERLGVVDPVTHQCRHLRPGRGSHLARERLDVVLAEGAGSFPVGCLWMGSDVPDRSHRQAVDMPHLGQREEFALRPPAGLDAVSIDPVGRGGVPADLDVLAKLLVADCAAFGQQQLNVLQDERVALDRGRAMSVRKPHAAPDSFCLDRRGKASEPLPQLADLNPQTLADGRTGRSPTPRLRELFGSGMSKPYPSCWTQVCARRPAICTEHFRRANGSSAHRQASTGARSRPGPKSGAGS